MTKKDKTRSIFWQSCLKFAIGRNMQAMAWRLFTLAYVLAFFISYGMVEDISPPIGFADLN